MWLIRSNERDVRSFRRLHQLLTQSLPASASAPHAVAALSFQACLRVCIRTCCMCVCIYVHVCMCTNMYLCIYIHVYIDKCTYAYVYICIRMCMYTYE